MKSLKESVMFGLRYGISVEDSVRIHSLLEKANAEYAEEPKLPHPLRGASRYLSQDFIEQLYHDTTPQNSNR